MAEKQIQVRLTTARSGVDIYQAAGEVITVRPAEAKSLLNAGQAEPVANPKAKRAEKRVTTPAEKRG